ncbi:hypothetical protein IFO70_15255 [Phormidium tenue FACHB-886]|nr:hypothetical protein [Phormidium tenue FACHB-886]
MDQVFYSSVRGLIHLMQPLLVPLCFTVAWLTVILLIHSLWSALRDSVHQAKEMHRIPCANCQFFTNNHRLKCPVHPIEALSDEAINCPDYEPYTPSLSRFG